MHTGGWIAITVVVLLVVVFVGLYNGLVKLRMRVKNAWAQIDVQLKRRHDLIPNLVETCRGYMAHERETLEAVTKARQQAVDATRIADRAQAENFLTQTLRSLFAVSEAYPDLKANQNMLALQEELTSTENKIAFARQFYNDCVLTYNTRLQVVPSNLIAGLFNFKPEEMFELEEEAQREAPQVKF